MTARAGRLLLLAEGDGASPEAFTTVARLRTTEVSIDGETVDITNKDSGGWRELLPEAGTTSMSISAEGVYEGDASTQNNLELRAIAKTLHNYQLLDGDFILEGAWQVANFTKGGEHNAEQTFSVTLESSGVITRAAQA